MTWHLDFEHVGGILDGEARIEPGLNVIRASNWQGKSSFLESLETALGVSKPLTEGKAEGTVRYETPDSEGAVQLQRTDDGVHRSGDPLLTDTYDVARAELFACLDEENEVRQAVRTGSDLTEVMLRPLNFENIEEQITDLKREREQVDSEIARAEEAKKRLPRLEERVTELEAELESLRAERDRLAEDRAPVGEGEATPRDELTEAESELERVENRVQQLAESVERTESTLAETDAELADLEVDRETESEVASELASVQERLQSLRRDKTVLESVHSATEMVLAEERLDLITDVNRELSGDEVVCWTCGESASRAAFEDRLAALREQMGAIQARIDETQATAEELEAERERISQARRQKESLEADRARLRDKLSEDKQSLEAARERREELSDRVERLSDAVTESVSEITDVESEIKYREAELDDVRDDVDEIEQRAARLETLRDDREAIQSEIQSLRDRKTSIRRETRAAFDAAIRDVLDRFETGFETARLTSEFELVVARDGRRASLDALSEGELELLGFVAALAGYEAFDVSEVTPLLLVDRVGGLDERNLRDLVDYLRPRTDYLVFTAYPAYDSADAHVLDPGDWHVTGDG